MSEEQKAKAGTAGAVAGTVWLIGMVAGLIFGISYGDWSTGAILMITATALLFIIALWASRQT